MSAPGGAEWPHGAAEDQGHRTAPGPAKLAARARAGRQRGRRRSGRTAAPGWALPPRRSGLQPRRLCTLTLTSFTCPARSWASRSTAGPTRRLGAHHGDHTTTSTGILAPLAIATKLSSASTTRERGLRQRPQHGNPVAAAGIRILNPVSSGPPLGGGRCNPHRDRRKLLVPVKPAS